jgi:hypothetical protein
MGHVRLDLTTGPQLERLNAEGWRSAKLVESRWAKMRCDRIEVINASVGGYLAWRAFQSFQSEETRVPLFTDQVHFTRAG